MELFWVILCYIAVLAVCFLIGEYLKDCRIAKKQPLKEADCPEETPPETAVAELQPHPRQTAQELSRELERMALDLAEHFGLEQSRVDAFFAAAASRPPKAEPVIIDLKENPSRE